ncbi:MAG: PorT family protein [Bacteroidales bacterium]|nr:PorT family protein [Bacteroidales bacterium]
MSHNEFHNLREKLYDVQMPVEADLWQDIEATMRRRRMRRMLYYASSVAAVVLLVLLLLLPGGEIGQPQGQTLVAEAVSDKVPSEVAAVVVAEPAAEVAAVAEPSAAADVVAEPAGAMEVSGAEVVPVAELGYTAPVGNTASEEKAASKVNVASEAVASEVGKNAVAEADAQEAVAAQSQTVAPKERRAAMALADDILEFGDERERGNRGYTLAFSQGIMPGSAASVAGSRVMASSAFGGALEHSHMVEQVSDTKYSLPVNAGLQIQFPVGENMAVGVGVNYSMLKSKYDCLIDKVHYNVKQKLHYIGVPVNVYGLVVERNNFSFYVNAGVTLEKGIRAVYELNSYRDSQKYRADIEGVQFSINAGLGVEYKFGNAVGLYFEPNLVYYTNSEVMYSIRTDQPFQVKADIGFRFHF